MRAICIALLLLGMVANVLAGVLAGIDGEYERATMNFAAAILNLLLANFVGVKS